MKKFRIDKNSHLGNELKEEIKKIEQKAKQDLWNDLMINFQSAFSRSHPNEIFRKICKKHNLTTPKARTDKKSRFEW